MPSHGPGNRTPKLRRMPQGSGTFTHPDLKRGFRVLEKPVLRNPQTPVAFPGVPVKKKT